MASCSSSASVGVPATREPPAISRPTATASRAARLGRHALLFSAAANQLIGQIDEPVVYDHLETFEVTQDLPCGIGTPVGHKSWYTYDVDPAPHHRAGRMSKTQRARPWVPRGSRSPSALRGTLPGRA